jgi:hypothetical protein
VHQRGIAELFIRKNSTAQERDPVSQFPLSDAMMTIYVNPPSRNADWSSRNNFESGANVTDTSRHDEKQDSQMTSTEPGTAIDVKPLSRNADAPTATISNRKQMSLTQVMHMTKSSNHK